MKKQQIVSILKDLHKISGFRISLHGPDYLEIAAYPEVECGFCRAIHSSSAETKKCNECDRFACKRALEMGSTYTYRCRYGLVEAVSPLYSFGTLTGFLMMGQVLEKGIKPSLPPLKDLSELQKAANATADIPVLDLKNIEALIRIMTVCAEYMTLSNATSTEKTSVAEMAKRYVYENYGDKLLIKDICAAVGCSKSSLLTAFKREFGITVGEYINGLRLEKAKKMLLLGDKSIGDIAATAGFSDQSYFSKVFFSKYGISPSEYRQKNRKENVNADNSYL